jgi:hypothetical protein
MRADSKSANPLGEKVKIREQRFYENLRHVIVYENLDQHFMN